MPHIHDHHTATAPPGGRPDQTGTPVSGHPPWCSPQHCFLNEDGVWVHEQQPVRWEECEVRFESRLLFPDGEHPPTTYLQLSIDNLRLTWRGVDAFLPIAAARRLRDQLTAHLDAADPPDPGRMGTARWAVSLSDFHSHVLADDGQEFLGEVVARRQRSAAASGPGDPEQLQVVVAALILDGQQIVATPRVRLPVTGSSVLHPWRHQLVYRLLPVGVLDDVQAR